MRLKAVLAACWLSWLLNFSYRMFIPALMPAIKAELGLTDPQAGLMIGLLSLSYAASLGASSLLTLGLRDEAVVALSLLISSASFILSSASTSPEWLMVSLSLAGAGLGLYLPSAISLLSSSSPSSIKGRVLGIHETGAPLGQVLGPLVAGLVLSAGIPWRLCIPWWALPSISLAILFLAWLRGGHRHKVYTATKHQEGGGLPLRLYASFLTTYTCMAAGTGLIMIMPLYMTESFKLPAALAALVIALSRLTGVAGQVLCGLLSDRLGRLRVLLSTIVITLASTFALVATPYGTAFILLLLVMAASHNAFFPVMFALITDVFKGNARLILGLTLSPGLLLGSGVVPYAVGWLAGLYGYSVAILLPPIIMAAALPAATLTYPALRSSSRSQPLGGGIERRY